MCMPFGSLPWRFRGVIGVFLGRYTCRNERGSNRDYPEDYLDQWFPTRVPLLMSRGSVISKLEQRTIV